MSKVYFARPVTLSGPSTRFTWVPMTVGLAGQLYFGSAGGGVAPRPGPWAGAGCCLLATLHPLHAGHGFEDTGKCAAAADITVESFFDLLECGVGIFFEQADARHDEARRAESAHQSVFVAEGLLHGMQLVAVRQAVNVANLLALYFNRER